MQQENTAKTPRGEVLLLIVLTAMGAWCVLVLLDVVMVYQYFTFEPKSIADELPTVLLKVVLIGTLGFLLWKRKWYAYWVVLLGSLLLLALMVWVTPIYWSRMSIFREQPMYLYRLASPALHLLILCVVSASLCPPSVRALFSSRQ